MYLDCSDSYRHAGNDDGIILYDVHQLMKAAINPLQKKKKKELHLFLTELKMKPATELCCHTEIDAWWSLHVELVVLQQNCGYIFPLKL